MPTPHAEASAHGYALERDAAGPFLRPIEGEDWFARPGVPARPGLHSRPGLITNYYTRPLLVEEGEYDTEPPPEEVRGEQRARISRRYVRDQQRQPTSSLTGKRAAAARNQQPAASQLTSRGTPKSSSESWGRWRKAWLKNALEDKHGGRECSSWVTNY